jgi:AcrR family transcriptional regulator
VETRKRRTETRVLEAARTLFDDRGYAATTTELVAGRAGVGPATIFKRFQSKPQLLAAVVEAQLAERRRSKSDASIESRVEAALGALRDLVNAHPDWNAPLQEAVSGGGSGLLDLFGALIEEGRATGEVRREVEPRQAALVLITLLLVRLRARKESREKAVKAVVDLVFRGFGVR